MHQSAPVGPDFKPALTSAGMVGQTLKPTFPAYSAAPSSATISAPATNATISAAPTVKKPESSSGMSIKIMHPDEDISLVSTFFHF